MMQIAIIILVALFVAVAFGILWISMQPAAPVASTNPYAWHRIKRVTETTYGNVSKEKYFMLPDKRYYRDKPLFTRPEPATGTIDEEALKQMQSRQENFRFRSPEDGMFIGNAAEEILRERNDRGEL